MVELVDGLVGSEFACELGLVVHLGIETVKEVLQLVRHLEIAFLCDLHELFDLLFDLKLQVFSARKPDVLSAITPV